VIIELCKIPIREVFEGYVNNDEEGVVGYGGKLNIRPKYQREFIYKDKQRCRDRHYQERTPFKCYVLGKKRRRFI